jgi:hypothetical protein
VYFHDRERIVCYAVSYKYTNTTAANPHTIISPSSDSWVGPFIISVSVVIIIAAIARKFKHRSGKHKERHPFPDLVREKVLEKQHHRCADCNRVLNVVDWHHKNRDRSDNRESNCVALCPNCHAIKTRRHQLNPYLNARRPRWIEFLVLRLQDGKACKRDS